MRVSATKFVPVLPVKSADPDSKEGTTSTSASITWLFALRVATEVPGSYLGSSSNQFGSGFPVSNASIQLTSRLLRAIRSFHSAWSSAPLEPASRYASRTSSSTRKVTWGSKPIASFAPAISSSSVIAPCAPGVSTAFGAGNPMWLRTISNEG